MLWAQSATKDYIRAENKFSLSPSYSIHKSLNHRVARRIYGMKYSWRALKTKNRHNNRIKSSGQARMVYMSKTWTTASPPREGEPTGTERRAETPKRIEPWSFPLLTGLASAARSNRLLALSSEHRKTSILLSAAPHGETGVWEFEVDEGDQMSSASHIAIDTTH